MDNARVDSGCLVQSTMARIMRLVKLTPVVWVLFVSGLCFAQGWIEYVDRVERFSVNFPAEPTVRDITYMGERGDPYPARVYTAAEGPHRYAVTVVNYADAERVSTVRESIAHAAWNFRKRGGEVTYDAFAQVDRIGGHQLQITNADQSRTYVAIHLHERRLYILEATVPPGSPPPAQFQGSLVILDAEGNRIRYGLDTNGNRTTRVVPED